ncbi:SPOR domain-containing protein [Stappia indica]|uniref:SPOR domain-containing protein n=1 Tax=Stappia indica TaxID=538381 RepID=UPI001CD7177F|nr:SPOR domain-containing protein [Stappia indica]MCA1297051.1 SPOR domain-containing protein [Stappia indica]
MSRDMGWVLLWGGAAILFGVVGISSLFINQTVGFTGRSFAQVTLPPSGDVSSTASIDGLSPLDVGLYPSAGGSDAADEHRRIWLDIAALKREVGTLKHALAALRDEFRVRAEARAGTTPGTPGNTVSKPGDRTTAPEDVEITGSVPAAPAAAALPAPVARLGDRILTAVERLVGPASKIETLPAPVLPQKPEGKPAEAPAEAASVAAASVAAPAAKVLPVPPPAPVRIVLPPQDSIVPSSTASIGGSAGAPDDTPQRYALPVTRAAGRVASISGQRISRTDFAVDLGSYGSLAAAEAAWSGLTGKYPKLLSGVRRRILDDAPAKGGTRLTAGPFPNAADAAGACVFLTAEEFPCKPTVFVK